MSEAELWARRPESLPQLTERYLYLVQRQKEEDITDAYLGLRDALESYNPSFSVDFPTFASKHIKGRIVDGKRKEGDRIRGRLKKQREANSEADAHYKETGERIVVERHLPLRFRMDEMAKRGLFGREATIEEFWGGALTTNGDHELGLLLEGLTEQEKRIYGLFASGETADIIKEQTGLSGDQLAAVMASIKSKITGIKNETDVIDVSRVVTTEQKSTYALRCITDKLLSDPIFHEFSNAEKEIVQLIAGGMPLAEIAREKKIKYHVMNARWRHLKQCITEQGAAKYRADRQWEIERKNKKRLEIAIKKRYAWECSQKAKLAKNPLPTKSQLKADIKAGLTLGQIGTKYKRDQTITIRPLIAKYGLEHLRAKRVQSPEGKASRRAAMATHAAARRPDPEVFKQDIQSLSWHQMEKKYRLAKSSLRLYAIELGIFHLKCEPKKNEEASRQAGLARQAKLRQLRAEKVANGIVGPLYKINRQTEKPLVIKKRKPSYKELVRRANSSLYRIAEEFGSCRKTIKAYYQEYGLPMPTGLDCKRDSVEISNTTRNAWFKKMGMSPPTAEQMLNWYNTMTWAEIKQQIGFERISFLRYTNYLNLKLPVKPSLLTSEEKKEVQNKIKIKRMQKRAEAGLAFSKEQLAIDLKELNFDQIKKKYRCGKDVLKATIKAYGLNKIERRSRTEEERKALRDKMAATRGLPLLPTKEELRTDLKTMRSYRAIAAKYKRDRNCIKNIIEVYGMKDEIKNLNPKIWKRHNGRLEIMARQKSAAYPILAKPAMFGLVPPNWQRIAA